MAVAKFYDAVVTLGGSGGPPYTGGSALPHVRSVTINYSAEMLDITEMGNTTRVNLAGLYDWSIDVTVLHDWASGNTVQTLNALVGAAADGIQVTPTSSAVGTDNPEWYGQAVCETANPMDGAVGEATEITATFRCAGPLTMRTS
jgi:hypothetical protein